VHPLENPAENTTNTSAASKRQSADWDVQNAPKNYFSLVLTQGASAFFAFASVWLITKTLGSEGYGGIAAIIAASQLAQVFVNWTSLAVARFGVDEFIETEKIARAFWLRLFILLPNLVLVLLVSNFWFPPLANWLNLSPDSFWLVFLHFAVAALWIHFQFSLQAIKRLTFQGGLVAIERVLVFTGVLVLMSLGKLNSISGVICYTVAPLITTLVSGWILRRYIFARFSADWIFWRKILVFSLPLIPFTITTYLSGGYADAVFISKFLSTSDLGIYSVATQINGVALQLPTLFNSLLLSLFVSLQKESQTQKMTQYFKDMMPTLTLSWGLFTSISAFAAYFLLPLVFGAEFTQTVEPFWILFTTSTLIFPLLCGYGALSGSASATYIPMISAIFAGVTNVCFNFLLIPRFGMLGCAWASAIMYFVNSLTLALMLKKRVKIPISWTFFAPVPAVACALVFSLTKNPYWSLLVALAASGFIIYLEKESIKNTLTFLKKYKKA
jgi:O-antigen/teichoic acid export membrane protein